MICKFHVSHQQQIKWKILFLTCRSITNALRVLLWLMCMRMAKEDFTVNAFSITDNTMVSHLIFVIWCLGRCSIGITGLNLQCQIICFPNYFRAKVYLGFLQWRKPYIFTYITFKFSKFWNRKKSPKLKLKCYAIIKLNKHASICHFRLTLISRN